MARDLISWPLAVIITVCIGTYLTVGHTVLRETVVLRPAGLAQVSSNPPQKVWIKWMADDGYVKTSFYYRGQGSSCLLEQPHGEKVRCEESRKSHI